MGGRPFAVIHARIEADEFQHAALTSSPPTCTNCSSPKAAATSFHSASTTVYVKLLVGSSCPHGGSGGFIHGVELMIARYFLDIAVFGFPEDEVLQVVQQPGLLKDTFDQHLELRGTVWS